MAAPLIIDGVCVSFPFEPYPAQVEYMESVLRALKAGTDALLESPTGTGKTLCLLCAALAWQEQQRRAHRVGFLSSGASILAGGAPPSSASTTIPSTPFKIVYCSRTHAQLTQVVRELKRMSGTAEVTMAVLGSREHMCVNAEVSRLPSLQAQQSMCHALRADKSCRFYRATQTKSAALLSTEVHLHDMEDLVREGRQNGFCPYYYERDQAKDADIVFLPYNYVLDSSLRKQLPFEIKNCILIIDEAHNLPGVLSASGCLNLAPLDLTNAIHDCSRAIAWQRMEREKGEGDLQESAMAEQEFASLKILLARLESCIVTEDTASTSASPTHTETVAEKRPPPEPTAVPKSGTAPLTMPGEIVRPGRYMRHFLAKAHITVEVFDGANGAAGMNDAMSKMITLLAQSERPAAGTAKVQQFLSAVFSTDGVSEEVEGEEEGATRFVLQSLPADKKSTTATEGRRVLGYWLLDNSRDMLSLSQQVHSLILTSGTLSPLDHFAAEVGLLFGVQLQGSHVIQPEQVLGSVLCKAPGGEKLNGSYAFRGSVDYRAGLGMALVNLCRNIPGGVLVFFPSYTAMNSAVDLWRAGTGRPGEAKTVWGMLSEVKPIFVEPSDTGELTAVVHGFQKAVDDAPKRGAVLLAVCRGKISEGVDFADQHGRCVVVTGIPYANHTDLFVRLKRSYLTQVAPHRPKVRGRLFTGDDWYRNEAMRAVNQCIGRVIRHKDDYGVMVLADERFAEQLGSLSEWVARRTAVHREFRDSYATVARFFAERRPARPATADGPYVVLHPQSTDRSAVPASAALAKAFAEEQARQTAEEDQKRQRRRLEALEEIPQRTVVDISRTPHPQQDVASSTPAPCTTALPQMQKQTLPTFSSTVPSGKETPGDNVHSTPTRSAGTLPAGASSKEFCAYLKAHVPSRRYDDFKAILRKMASLRAGLLTSTPGTLLSSQGAASTSAEFKAAVADLQVLFKEADARNESGLLIEFGRHIPQEFAADYARLIKTEFGVSR